jgi:hypothetical protein
MNWTTALCHEDSFPRQLDFRLEEDLYHFVCDSFSLVSACPFKQGKSEEDNLE